MAEPVSRGTLLRFFKDALRDRDSGHQSDLVRAAMERVTREFPDLLDRGEPGDAYLDKLVAESLTFLVFQGVIVPKSGLAAGGRPAGEGEYIVTDYGRDWAAAETEPMPEDAAGFLRFLKDQVPELDADVFRLAGESLGTFNRGFLTASAVLLGAASERSFYLLAESLARSPWSEADAARIRAAMEQRHLGTLRETVFGSLQELAASGRLPYSVHQDATAALQSLFAAVMVQRDDAVHPIAASVTKSQLRLLLLSFPHVCRKTSEIVACLERGRAD